MNNWCLAFHRNCFDWEVPRSALLLNDLDKMALNVEAPNTIVWQTNGQYFVDSCYRELNKEGGSNESWSWKELWTMKAPYKIKIVFLWLVAHDACLTQGSLQKSGF